MIHTTEIPLSWTNIRVAAQYSLSNILYPTITENYKNYKSFMN